MNKDINIQKIRLDLNMDHHDDPNVFLLKVRHELKEIVLPLLEKELKSHVLGNDSNVSIDKIELDFTSKTKNSWQKDLSKKVAQKIKEAYHNEKSKSPVSEQLFEAMTRFLEVGLLSDQDVSNYRELEEKWQTSAHKKDLFIRLGQFLNKHQKPLEHFLEQSNSIFIQDVLTAFVPESLAVFLAESDHFLQKGIANNLKMIRIALSCDKKDNASFSRMIANQQLQMPPILEKVLEKMKEQQTDELTQLIESKSETKLIAFIRYLRSDNTLISLIDPFLSTYYHHLKQQGRLENWFVAFCQSIQNNTIAQEILMELEDFSSNDPSINKPDFFDDALKQLVKNLEEQQLKTNVKEHLIPQQIANAGIVLLNPFLPNLFNSINLFNDKNEWLSINHQVAGIYAIHYLATESFEAEENELYLAKILTNYPLDERLPTYEENQTDQSIDFEEQLTTELTPLLTAIHENWRPMRNCTWAGLRNDFLSRTGELSQQENKQYLLTIEPHTLDVLLPSKNWGISMIKYSWMEEVVNVGWK